MPQSEKKKRPLTVKQRRFVKAYLDDPSNTSEAMRKAGYSPHRVNVTAAQQLAKPSIQEVLSPFLAELQRLVPDPQRAKLTAEGMKDKDKNVRIKYLVYTSKLRKELSDSPDVIPIAQQLVLVVGKEGLPEVL